MSPFEQQVAAALVGPLKRSVGDKEGWGEGDFTAVAEELAPPVAAAIEAAGLHGALMLHNTQPIADSIRQTALTVLRGEQQ